MAFNGKLIELKTGNSYVDFPLKYVGVETYKITPNQRLENSANRATTGLLVRTTVQHTATKVEFETPAITNKESSAINTLLTNAYTDPLQRKLDIRYYDPASDSYLTATCYVPDVEYNINHIDATNNIIYYNPVRIAFIEY